jgi:hypothetical protein
LILRLIDVSPPPFIPPLANRKTRLLQREGLAVVVEGLRPLLEILPSIKIHISQPCFPSIFGLRHYSKAPDISAAQSVPSILSIEEQRHSLQLPVITNENPAAAASITPGSSHQKPNQLTSLTLPRRISACFAAQSTHSDNSVSIRAQFALSGIQCLGQD